MFKFFWDFREREIYNSSREGFMFRFNKSFPRSLARQKPDKRLVLSLSKIGGGTRMTRMTYVVCACKCMCDTGHLLCNIYSFNRPGSSLKEGRGGTEVTREEAGKETERG